MNSAKLIAYSPYGAFELKRCYQKNMLLGTLISSLMALVVIGAFTLAAYLSGLNKTAIEGVNEKEVPGVKVKEIKTRLIRNRSIPPDLRGKLPELDLSVGSINLIDDDEAFEIQALATNFQKAIVAEQEFNNGLQLGLGGGIDTAELFPDLDPAPDEFIPRDENPVLLEAPAPEYPEMARKAGIEAVVWITVLVDTEGNVKDALVSKSSGRDLGFDEAALAAAWDRRYRPAMQNDKPVAVWVHYRVRFEIKN
jgi:protein TonB